MSGVRHDFDEILRLVRPGARVLDIGCGEGELLERLKREKGVDGRGLEISQGGVAASLARGLAVVQGDADRDLFDYPTRAFDYAILSQTLQTVRDPKAVLTELMRIAERAIVSFPNFGYWLVRLGLLTTGRMPTTKALPTPWWVTPNIHLCTLRDFTDLVDALDLRVEASAALSSNRPARLMGGSHLLENWRAESALFLLARKDAAPEPPAERRSADRLL